MPPSAQRGRARRDISVPERDRSCPKECSGPGKEKPPRNVRRDLKRLAELGVRTTCRDKSLRECMCPDITPLHERRLSSVFRDTQGKRAACRHRCRPGCIPKTPQGLSIIRDNASPGVARALDWTPDTYALSSPHPCNNKTPGAPPADCVCPPGARPIPQPCPPRAGVPQVCGKVNIPRDTRGFGVARALDWSPEQRPECIGSYPASSYSGFPAPNQCSSTPQTLPSTAAPPSTAGFYPAAHSPALPRMQAPPPSAPLPGGGYVESGKCQLTSDMTPVVQQPRAYYRHSQAAPTRYCSYDSTPQSANTGSSVPMARNVLLDYMKCYYNSDKGRQQSTPPPSTFCNNETLPPLYKYQQNNGLDESPMYCYCAPDGEKHKEMHPHYQENAAYALPAPCPYCHGDPGGCSYCGELTEPSIENIPQANASLAGSTSNSCPMCGAGAERAQPAQLHLQLNLPLDLVSMQGRQQNSGAVLPGSSAQYPIPLTLQLQPSTASLPVYCVQ